MRKEKETFRVAAGPFANEIDLQDPEMPEEVRRYLRETADQLRELGAEGLTGIPGEVMPDSVLEYISAITEKAASAKKGDLMDRPVRLFNPDALGDFMREKIPEIEAEYGKKLPDAFRKSLTAALAELWQMLCAHDGDWGRLTISDALRLFVGVAMMSYMIAERAEARK